MATPRGGAGGSTPGRSSVRDKLNINPDDALSDQYESEYAAKQQQVGKVGTGDESTHPSLKANPNPNPKGLFTRTTPAQA